MTDDLCVMAHAKDPDRPRRALDGAYLCHGHVEELRRLVAEMPSRYDDLERALRVGGQRPSGTDGGLSIDEPMANHRRHMAGVLASWARLIADDRGVTQPADAEVSRTAPWLIVHVDWCAGQRWVDEMLMELREVNGRAIGLSDIPARRVPLGERCRTVDGEDKRCPGEVTMVVRGDDWSASCSECGGGQDPTPYLRTVKAGRWMTGEGVITLARLFGVPCSAEVVRQWRHRKRIKGQELDGQIWYDLASVQTYLAKRERMSA